MPKMATHRVADARSDTWRNVKPIQTCAITSSASLSKGLSEIVDDKSKKMCKRALFKLMMMQCDQDSTDWESFVKRCGEDKIVEALKENTTVKKVWFHACGGDSNETIEIYDGIEFVLKHFMPSSLDSAMTMSLKFPNLAFRVIVDDSSEASMKVRAMLASDPEKEAAFKREIRKWYEEKEGTIDLLSQSGDTLPYIGYSQEV